MPLDAQIVGEELERLRKRNDGKLNKEDVVNEARSTKSPLHGAFEWNDDVAAEQFRLMQAGYMIRSVSVIFESPDDQQEREIRAFVSVKHGTDEKNAYTSLQVAMQNPLLRDQVFQQALTEINTWKRKYVYLTIFARVFAEVDALNDMIADSYKIKTTDKKMIKAEK